MIIIVKDTLHLSGSDFVRFYTDSGCFYPLQTVCQSVIGEINAQ